MSSKCEGTKSPIGSLASLPYMMTSVYMAKTLQNMTTIYLNYANCSGPCLVFNSNKCSICQPQISFYGAIFTAQGMKPDPVKVQALQDLPAPHTPKQLQSFLGLVNYLQPFIPSLASKTTFLREQVTNWDWNPSTDQSFHHLKSWICNTLLRTTLAYYDCTQPLVLQTDASKYGLSAALLQNN